MFKHFSLEQFLPTLHVKKAGYLLINGQTLVTGLLDLTLVEVIESEETATDKQHMHIDRGMGLRLIQPN